MWGQINLGRRKASRRRGVAAVEAALVFPLFLWILLAMMDLGLAALRTNALSDAARRTAREVLLRGALANGEDACWGPEELRTTAAADLAMTDSLQHTLPTMPADQVEVLVRWPDGGNRPGDRVRVDLRFEHRSLVPGVLPWGPLELRASTVMPIVN